MSIYKVEAEGDQVFIETDSQESAERILEYHMGEIPKSMLTWSVVDELPEGEELLNG